MPLYEVRGTVEFNWSVTLHADDENEAERLARDVASDGDNLDDPTGDVDVISVELASGEDGDDDGEDEEE